MLTVRLPSSLGSSASFLALPMQRRWLSATTACCSSAAVERRQQITLGNLSPHPGSHIKKQRLGRGGKRGGTSGRGQGGQKHHNNRPPPWFTGLYTNPIIDALPRWNWSPRELKPVYKVINLDQIQRWIDLGRLDPTRPITLYELYRSRLVHAPLRDGVKLLSRGAEYWKTPNVRLEVSRASHAAIHAIEQCGGSVSTVYHTRRGLDCVVHPEKYPLVPPFERPVLEKDIEYYNSPLNRGYLSDRAFFERVFQPRGYIADEEMEQQVNREVHHVNVRFTVPDLNDRLKKVQDERKVRLYLHEKEQAAKEVALKERADQWKEGRWFPEQGEWRWIEVVDGQVKTNFQLQKQDEQKKATIWQQEQREATA